MSHSQVLVLGGSAFIGRQLVDHLLTLGQQVTVLNRGAQPAPSGVEQLVANRGDPASMRRALAGRRWDVVYDVSASVQVTSVEAVADLIDFLDGRCGVYVFVSSIAAYRMGNGAFPWTEELPTTRSRGTKYGGHKAAIEQLLADRRRASGFAFTIVRPAAVYGPHNNIPDGEMAMFLRLLQNRPVLIPHAGLVCFPYGHVADLSRALVLAAENPAAIGEVFNITADAVTARHYAHTIAKIVGVEPQIIELPDDVVAGLSGPLPFNHRFQQMLHSVLSIDKARRLLGFEPSFDFAAGHRQTFEWFLASGHDKLQTPMNDPTWNMSWDFTREAAVIDALKG